MAEDPNSLVFARPTPDADRIAFGIGGALSLCPLFYSWSLNHFAISSFDYLSYTEIGLLTAWIFGSISLLAVAAWGGTVTVTINRKTRELSEVAKVGPFTAVDKTVPFKNLGKPMLYAHKRQRFIVEVPVKDRVAVQIGSYQSRAEAEAVLRAIVAALDVAEPPAEPGHPAAIDPLKAASLAARGPIGF